MSHNKRLKITWKDVREKEERMNIGIYKKLKYFIAGSRKYEKFHSTNEWEKENWQWKWRIRKESAIDASGNDIYVDHFLDKALWFLWVLNFRCSRYTEERTLNRRVSMIANKHRDHFCQFVVSKIELGKIIPASIASSWIVMLARKLRGNIWKKERRERESQFLCCLCSYK